MDERRTSAAKDILTPQEQSLLESYGVMTNHFDHARDPTISQQLFDAEKQQQREASKEDRGSILEDGGQFITQPQDRAAGNDNAIERDGSQMVQNDKPSPEMRPSEEFAHPADKAAFEQKWAEEQARADQRVESRDNDRDNEIEPSYER